MASIFLLP